MLVGKHILLGIGGGIAVYKLAELARLFIKQGAEVRCVMTQSACEFVTPLTFEALTGNAVHTTLFDLTQEREMGHIQLARWADMVVLAPATANMLAHLAHGIADDLLTTLMQVCEKPVLIAPAMNHSMWHSAATQRNIHVLQQRGMHLLAPESGDLVCGESGVGRLPEPEQIFSASLPSLAASRLQGQHWLINAGPTHEAWDTVRILSNRASGHLGACLAEYAAMQGAQVSFVAGPGVRTVRGDIQRFDVQTAQQMLQACKQAAITAEVFIATAAVSDFRFAEQLEEKLKRGESDTIQVALQANTDIVAHIAAMEKRPKTVIAFAAESDNEHMLEYAKAKRERKGVNVIIANTVSNMGQAQASAYWLDEQGEQFFEVTSKEVLAERIIEKILKKEGSI